MLLVVVANSAPFQVTHRFGAKFRKVVGAIVIAKMSSEEKIHQRGVESQNGPVPRPDGFFSAVRRRPSSRLAQEEHKASVAPTEPIGVLDVESRSAIYAHSSAPETQAPCIVDDVSTQPRASKDI